MLFFAKKNCYFFPRQYKGIYSLDYHSTCRLEARQVLIYQCISDLTGKNDKYNYLKAVHLSLAFSDIFLSAKNYKIALALTVRRCKNCGRYFPLIVRISAEYCERPNTAGKICRATASASKWIDERRDNKVFREYRREYKRRFAWIKAGKITAEDFYAWSDQAREKKAECENGKIPFEEYQNWLKQS